MKSTAITLSLGVMMVVAILVTPMIAHATPPVDDLQSQPIYSEIDGIDMQLIQDAVDRVSDESTYSLYVAIVDSFDGLEGSQWALESAENSGLDDDTDVLYAIAVGDRKYGSAYPENSVVGDQIQSIEEAAIESLKSQDWSQAVADYGSALVDVSRAVIAKDRSEKDQSANGSANVVFWVLVTFSILGSFGIIVSNVIGKLFSMRHSRRSIRDSYAKYLGSLYQMRREIEAYGAKIKKYGELYPDEDTSEYTRLYEQAKTTWWVDRENLDDLKQDKSLRRESVRTISDSFYYAILDVRQFVSELDSTRLDQGITNADDAKSGKEALDARMYRAQSALPDIQENLKEAQTRFSEEALAPAVVALSNVDTTTADVDYLLIEAQEYINSEFNGQAALSVKKASQLLDELEESIATVKTTLANLDNAKSEADSYISSINSSLKFLNDGSRSVQANQELVNRATVVVAEWRATDFTAGNPLPVVQRLHAFSADLKREVESMSNAEKRLREAERNIDQATENFTAMVKSVDSLRARYSRYLHDADFEVLQAEIESIIQTTLKTFTESDIVESYSNVQEATYVVEGLLKDFESRAQRKISERKRREREEERKRQAQNTALGIGLGYGVGSTLGSFDSSNNSSSFGSSGGSFGSGGGFGSSGGSF